MHEDARSCDTVRALIKSGRFDCVWNALMVEISNPANHNRRPEAVDSRAT